MSSVGNIIVSLFLISLSLRLRTLPSTDSAAVCGAQQIRITDPVTKRVVGCEGCKWCQAGSGSSVTCGGSVTANTGIRCVPCVTRTTYSAAYSPNACDECAKCGQHRAVTGNCTTNSDTQCATECDKGFYPDGVTGMCQPCSYCCGDGDDHVMKKCITDGMAANQQCGIGRSEYCGQVVAGKSSHITGPPSPSPTPTNEKGSNKSAGNTTRGNSKDRFTTEEPNSSTIYSKESLHKPMSFWMVVCFVPLACIISTAAAVSLWRWKNRQEKDKQERTERIHGQETVTASTGVDSGPIQQDTEEPSTNHLQQYYKYN